METVLVCALCLCACACAARVPAPAPPHRDVHTAAGAVRGYLAPRPPHFSFLGLPYARPPAARDKFKRPEAAPQWGGVLEATYRVRCAQPQPRRRRRDPACLVLNVFVPERATALPVLVHLHDGHFATGWGSHTAPSRLLSQGLVVVTLNYRLGAEGFLCLGTQAAPGNAGLKDQVSALSWVHTNIDKFGGDPSQVTLYGTGAGAAAAELLLLSGAVDSFIQRVILESGSALAPTSLSLDPVATALHVAVSLGYKDDETKTTDDLTTFYQDIAIEKTMNFSDRFTPCVENVEEYYSALIIKDPKEILESGILKTVPLLIAYNKEKSSLNNGMFHNVPNNFEQLLPNNLEFETEDMKLKIADKVKETYFGEEGMRGDVVEGYESYINDVLTAYPIVKSATLHASASSSPVYLMEYLPQDGANTIFDYIFGKKVLDEEEELVAEKLTVLWSNFVKYSDPTPLETSLLPEVWLPVSFKVKNDKPDISTASSLIFDLGQMSMGTPSSGHTLSIWDHIYDIFYKSHTPQVEMLESEVLIYDEDIALLSMFPKLDTNSEETNNENGNEEQINNDQNYGEENYRKSNNEEDNKEEENDRKSNNEEDDKEEENDRKSNTEEDDKEEENDRKSNNEEDDKEEENDRKNNTEDDKEQENDRKSNNEEDDKEEENDRKSNNEEDDKEEENDRKNNTEDDKEEENDRKSNNEEDDKEEENDRKSNNEEEENGEENDKYENNAEKSSDGEANISKREILN